MDIRIPERLRTFTYCRIAAGRSADAQLAEIHATGLRPDPQRIVVEAAAVGVPVRRRRRLLELLAMMEAGDTLLIASLETLGRNACEIQQTVDRLTAASVVVYCAEIGVLNVAGAEGLAVRRAIKALSECEHELLVERTQSSIVRARGNSPKVARSRMRAPIPAAATEERVVEIPAKDASRHAIEALAMLAGDDPSKR
jgi:putative DNA-invertase from lambdoid prophage Rac